MSDHTLNEDGICPICNEDCGVPPCKLVKISDGGSTGVFAPAMLLLICLALLAVVITLAVSR